MLIYEDKENKLPSATRVAASSHVTQLAAKEKLKEATGGNGRNAGILRTRGYNGTAFASTTGTATGTAPKRRAATVAYQFEGASAGAKRPEWSRAQRVLHADRVDPSCLLPEKVSNERSSKPLGYADLLYDSPAAVQDIDHLRTSADRGKQVRVVSPRSSRPTAAPNTSSATATATKNVSDGNGSGRQPQRENFKHILDWKPRSSRGVSSSRKDDGERKNQVAPTAAVSAATAVTAPKTAVPAATAGAHVSGAERAKQVKPTTKATTTPATSISGKSSKTLWSGLGELRVRRVPAGESTDEDDDDTETQVREGDGEADPLQWIW